MIFDNEKPRLRAEFADTYIDHVGAVRWLSSLNAVPGDIMLFWQSEGLVSGNTVDITTTSREEDNARAVEAYIVARNNMTDEQKAEEAYEIKAAYGPGEKVVNIFTGERWET